MPESAAETRPSRLRGFLVAVVATILAYLGAQELIQLMGWSENFILFMALFIGIDAALMFVFDKLLGR